MKSRFDYECFNDKCGVVFEVEQAVKDDRLVVCPICEQESLERIILQAPLGFVEREATTVGQLAERNSKKMGKNGVISAQKEIERQQLEQRKQNRRELQKKLPKGVDLVEVKQDKPETPWFGKLDKKKEKEIFSDSTGKKIEKYIMEGK